MNYNKELETNKEAKQAYDKRQKELAAERLAAIRKRKQQSK